MTATISIEPGFTATAAVTVTAQPRRFTKTIRSAKAANAALAAMEAAGLKPIRNDEPLGPGEFKAHFWRSCSTGEFTQLELAYGHTRRLV